MSESSEASIFNKARELHSVAEREAYLASACNGDPALKQRVEDLLSAFHAESQFLEQPAAELNATIAHDDPTGSRDESPSKNRRSARVNLHSADESEHVVREDSSEIPERFSDDRFQIQGEIARGGMGAIIKAHDTDLGRELAIKVLLKEHKTRPDMNQRFVEEAQIGGQLQHPGIAPVYDVGRCPDDRPFFSMKLVKGMTLLALLNNRKDSFDERGKFVGIFHQICQTMAYAHSRGVIHRDLKPANIMVGAFGEVQVMDWGLAKVLPIGDQEGEQAENETQHNTIQTLRNNGDTPVGIRSADSDTRLGSVMGTPAYMPPEQALGEIDRLDRRADVFGLGAILCEILTGEPPYTGDGDSVFRQATRGQLDECLARLNASGAAPGLIDLATRCLNADPAERPHDAGALADLVTRHLESVEKRLRESEIERAEQATRYAEEQKRRRLTAALAGSVLLLVSIAAGGWFYIDQQATKRRSLAANRVQATFADARLHRQLAEAVDIQSEGGLEDRADELEQAHEIATQTLGLAKEQRVPKELVDSVAEFHSAVGTAANDARKLATEAAADQAIQRELEFIRHSSASYATGRVIETTRTDNGQFPMHNLGLDPKRTSQMYEELFRERGRDLTTIDLEEAAAWIKQSPIRENLITAIDDWSRVASLASSSGSKPKALAERLRQLASTADDNAWRVKMRKILASNDVNAMKELADSAEVDNLPPAPIAWLGAALRQVKLLDEAARILRQADLRHPGDYWLNHELAVTLFWQDDPECETYARAAVAIQPDSAGALIVLLQCLNSDESLARAEPLANRIVQLTEGSWVGLISRALSRAAQGRLEEAILDYREALRQDPGNSVALCNLGLMLRWNHQNDEAYEAYANALQADPDSAQTRFLLGTALSTDGRMEEAVEEFKKAIEIRRDHAMAYCNLSKVYMEQGKLGGALKTIEKAIEIDPRLALYHYNHGVILYAKLNVRGAIQAYERAIELRPDFVSPYINLGAIYNQTLRLKEAHEYCLKAVELDPQNAQAHNNLGMTLRGLNRHEDAAESFRKATDLDASEAEYHGALAYELILLGEHDEGLKANREVLRLNPDHPRVNNNVAWLLIRDRDASPEQIAEALEKAQRACDLAKRDHLHWNTLGMARYRNGDWKLALRAFETSGDFYRHSQYNWLFRAMVYWRLDEKAEAKKWWDKAAQWREKNTPDEELRRVYQEAEELMKNIDDDAPKARVGSEDETQSM